MELSFFVKTLEVVAGDTEGSVGVKMVDFAYGCFWLVDWCTEDPGPVGVVEEPSGFLAFVEELLPVLLIEFIDTVKCLFFVLSVSECVRDAGAESWCERGVEVEWYPTCLENGCLFLCEAGDV